MSASAQVRGRVSASTARVPVDLSGHTASLRPEPAASSILCGQILHASGYYDEPQRSNTIRRGSLRIADGTDREGSADPDGVARSRTVRVALIGFSAVAVLAVVVVVAWVVVLSSWFGEDWGEVESTLTSADGSHEAVVYSFRAVIDPGWVVALQRGDGSEREWVWRSVETVAPESVRFTGPSTLEILGDDGVSYVIDYDESTLVPTERYCLNLEYCRSAPWDDFTKSGP